MIKYYVRTTGERKLHESYNQIEYELLIDKEHKPVVSFINQLKYISQYDSVLLEDDLILCKDFKYRIEKAIRQYKKHLINFYCEPHLWFTTHTTLGVFRCNQCTYYPKGLSLEIANAMETLNDNKSQYDLIEHWALQTLKIPHVKYRPMLVQHIGKKSLLNNHYHKTPYFIDYLEELNIDYKEAYKDKNLIKLQEIMNRNNN